MTTSQTTPSYPLFHVRSRSTLHGVALIALCVALGVGFVSQIWSGPTADGARAGVAAVERA
jgi:hypothetical protein